MNWEAIGAVGEIIGALAVVVTLAYLAVQVRQNSRLAKATIRENRTDSSQKIIFALADVAEILAKEPSRQSEAEELRIQLLFRAMFRDFEAYSYQKRTGLLDESEWVAMKETWRDILSSRTARELWEQSKAQYSQILHEDLEEILARDPTRD